MTRLFIGLMSGTSMDGIDAALVDVTSNTLISGITRPYSEEALQKIHAVIRGEQLDIGAISQLNTLLGQEFAAAAHQILTKAKVSTKQVIAIGSHGQTILHDPTANIPFTVQLGCAHTISELTGIPVVADFRTRDLVLGGQGAPFAPLYHQALFGEKKQTMAIVNVGGIANFTLIAPGISVCGYDTGPGNCLMDAWTMQCMQQPYDAFGAWAASGQVIEPLLQTLLSDPYFLLPAPKSLDKGYFSLQWLNQYLNSDFAAQDVQATLCSLTATSIVQAINSYHLNIELVAVCGGGVHNMALLQSISAQMPEVTVTSTESLGVNPDFFGSDDLCMAC